MKNLVVQKQHKAKSPRQGPRRSGAVIEVHASPAQLNRAELGSTTPLYFMGFVSGTNWCHSRRRVTSFNG
jgi:hypothetical protein